MKRNLVINVALVIAIIIVFWLIAEEEIFWTTMAIVSGAYLVATFLFVVREIKRHK